MAEKKVTKKKVVKKKSTKKKVRRKVAKPPTAEEKAYVPVGRPTKYKPEFCDLMIEFFSIEPVKYIEREIMGSGKDGPYVKEIRTEARAATLPTFAGFAREIGVWTSSLGEWRDKHEEFSVAYKECKKLQEQFLMTNALKGHYQANFTIFTMKNVCGWRDKMVTEHEGGVKLESVIGQTFNSRDEGEDDE